MSLKLLLASLQNGRTVGGMNTLIQLVHECIEEFAEEGRKEEGDLAAVKEMVARLEERVMERIEGVRAAAARETELVAKGLEMVVRRVGNLEDDPR